MIQILRILCLYSTVYTMNLNFTGVNFFLQGPKFKLENFTGNKSTIYHKNNNKYPNLYHSLSFPLHSFLNQTEHYLHKGNTWKKKCKNQPK
jgi:hypothetical protein